MYRLTTALTDYMAFTSNSQLQKDHVAAKDRWDVTRIKTGQKVAQFSIAEMKAFDQLEP